MDRKKLILICSLAAVLVIVIILIFANLKDMSRPFIVVIDCDGHTSESAALRLLELYREQSAGLPADREKEKNV